jgi:hypothetical protein
MPNLTPDMIGYRLIQKTLVFCAALILVAVTAVFIVALNSSQSRCNEIQDIRTFVLESTERSLTATPTLDYYKTHPEELRNALENLRQQRDIFKTPLDCSLL